VSLRRAGAPARAPAGAALLSRMREASDFARTDPLSHMGWLPGQLRVFRSPRKRRLFRAGNQSVGKTICGLSEVTWCATGTHPFRPVKRVAGEYWVICATWPQSVAIQKKLWSLLPKHLLHPETSFNDVRGFKGKTPAVRVRCVDGNWSIIRFRTTRQGGLNLAGATIDGALFDEPPHDEAVYSEVAKRVQARGGWVLLTLTPVNAPCDWLRKLTEEGTIEDIHVPLSPEQLIPEGRVEPIRGEDGVPRDQAWIDAVIADTASAEVPVRIHGEWEMRVEGRYFDTFRSAGHNAHVSVELPSGPDVRFCIGLDHGSRPGKQIALLLAIDVVGVRGQPRIWVLDEYTDDTGCAAPEDDARQILAMLARWDLEWSHLLHVIGDRVHMPGTGSQKSNKDLAAHVAMRLSIPQQALAPKIFTVRKRHFSGSGPVIVGSRWLHQQITRGLFRIQPRCQRLIAAMERYTLADDEHKDPIDALRYALDPYIFDRRRQGAAATVALG
jgi:phage terminase large subunit-like protein